MKPLTRPLQNIKTLTQLSSLISQHSYSPYALPSSHSELLDISEIRHLTGPLPCCSLHLEYPSQVAHQANSYIFSKSQLKSWLSNAPLYPFSPPGAAPAGLTMLGTWRSAYCAVVSWRVSLTTRLQTPGGQGPSSLFSL